MFTGIIEGVGRLAAREGRGGDARLRIDVGTLPFERVQLGESIAVNGTCLTVVGFDTAGFQADASNETLSLTTLGQLPAGAVLRYVAKKGSICVDGVSLTVNAVDDTGFEVALVPHTVAHTAFGSTRPGDAVNLEVDLVARYVERLLATGEQP